MNAIKGTTPVPGPIITFGTFGLNSKLESRINILAYLIFYDCIALR